MKARACLLAATALIVTALLQGCGSGSSTPAATYPGGTGPTINPVIPPWPAGTNWTYTETTPTTVLTHTRNVVDPHLTNPNDGNSVLEMDEAITDGTTTTHTAYYFSQDTTGTVYFEGGPSVIGAGATPVWKVSPTQSILWPSPMKVGTVIPGYNITYSNGGTATTLPYSIDGEETVLLPVPTNGTTVTEAVNAFRITEVDQTNGLITVTWFTPSVGTLKIQTLNASNAVVSTLILNQSSLPLTI